MALLEVAQVALLAIGCGSTVLAYVQLGAAFLVGVALLHPMNFLQVGFERAALGEGLVAKVTLVWPHACGEQEGRWLAFRQRWLLCPTVKGSF